VGLGSFVSGETWMDILYSANCPANLSLVKSTHATHYDHSSSTCNSKSWAGLLLLFRTKTQVSFKPCSLFKCALHIRLASANDVEVMADFQDEQGTLSCPKLKDKVGLAHRKCSGTNKGTVTFLCFGTQWTSDYTTRNWNTCPHWRMLASHCHSLFNKVPCSA
jgi:hypothetical protein